jgi:hypothetical protein
MAGLAVIATSETVDRMNEFRRRMSLVPLKLVFPGDEWCEKRSENEIAKAGR